LGGFSARPDVFDHALDQFPGVFGLLGLENPEHLELIGDVGHVALVKVGHTDQIHEIDRFHLQSPIIRLQLGDFGDQGLISAPEIVICADQDLQLVHVLHSSSSGFSAMTQRRHQAWARLQSCSKSRHFMLIIATSCDGSLIPPSGGID
jgi:hypothetical protein